MGCFVSHKKNVKIYFLKQKFIENPFHNLLFRIQNMKNQKGNFFVRKLNSFYPEKKTMKTVIMFFWENNFS